MKKVLFVEDEPALQKALSVSLKAQGFEVLSAFDGESGLNMVKESSPDLVLLDLILPKMDGFTVLEELKKLPETKNTPVIVLTNLDDTEDVQKVLDLGATNYLIKASYNTEDIANKIKEILEK
jgi:DNA-binding response OmpR family regulator